MRENKFKAWDGKKFYKPILYDGLVYRNYRDFEDSINVNDEVIQYTGLKDKNGVEIYERYILENGYINPMTGEYISKKFEVVFDSGCFKVKCLGHSPYGDTLLYFINNESEIIGNIFKNEELLEEV